MSVFKLKIIVLITAVAFVFIATGPLALASMLTYKTGTTPFNGEIQTVSRMDKIGSIPVSNGMLEINGRSISVSGSVAQFGEPAQLLSGQLVNTTFFLDKAGAHIKGIAYFTEGKLLGNQVLSRQRDIVFIEGGFIGGKIISITAHEITVDDQGSNRSIALNKVLGIRSPRAYMIRLDMTTLNTNDSNNGLQYDLTDCSLRESVPPRMISSQSIAPRSELLDDEIENLPDDMLLDPARGLGL